MVDAAKLKKAAPRLANGRARNIWFGTVRADGRPHLVPLWYVWHKDKLWVCVGRGTQKYVNLQKNPNVVLALEDAVSPVIIEGTASDKFDKATIDDLVIQFVDKYDWDFPNDDEEDWVLVGVELSKILMW